MNVPSVSPQAAPSVRQDRTDDTRLRGRWLALALIVWGILVIPYLVSFIVSLPVYATILRDVCMSTSCAAGQLTNTTSRRLIEIGLSMNLYSAFFVMLNVLTLAVCMLLAALLLVRKSNDWMALLVAFWLVAVLGTSIITTDLTTLQEALGQVPGLVLFSSIIFLDTISTFLVFALFPTGRFIPSWTRWILIIGGILMILILVAIPPSSSLWFILTTVLFFGMMSIAVVAQFYRYRFVSSPVQRQQTKWVIFSFTVCLLLSLGLFLPEWLAPELNRAGSPYQVTNVVSWYVQDLLIALSFGIALLRYRLYDVDVFINRTLVYGTLTVTLALVYLGCVVLLQHLVNGITGQAGQSPLVIVASTLAIAALFSPLRRRIQKIIDKRFYRRQYDAATIIANFSDSLRSEMDLNTLREHLVAVVEETMQPAHVSLWLRPYQGERSSQMLGAHLEARKGENG